jgi:hypothetical protein
MKAITMPHLSTTNLKASNIKRKRPGSRFNDLKKKLMQVETP